MNRFSKELLEPYFEPWNHVRDEIDQLYEERNPNVVKMMEEALANYMSLLTHGGTETNHQTEHKEYLLLPLNGDERLEFIKKQIHSRYAFIQLSALYDETRKKAARLSVTHKS